MDKPIYVPGYGYTEESMRPWVAMVKPHDKDCGLGKIAKMAGVKKRTLSDHYKKAKKDIIAPFIKKPEPTKPTGSKILFLDIETLPNLGFFFDTYSERAIALDFILKPKAVCTIAYKWAEDTEATVICAITPYEDKDVLEQILPIIEQANAVCWHFGEGFDRKFIDGRLFINGLPALPPVASIDTYKLARSKFGRTLNSNKLDHLGQILGLGRKNKTDAMLWVKCAQGDMEAMQIMAEYNAQDVMLLEAVYKKLAPNVPAKLNHNLLHDDAVCRCKSCGSSNITLKGHEFKASNFSHRYQCEECHNWSTFPRKKT
jgi:uncharacterized protein YprB with RNaseH-like and TPR domain